MVSEQEVLRPNITVLEVSRLFLRKAENFTCLLGEFIESIATIHCFLHLSHSASFLVAVLQKLEGEHQRQSFIVLIAGIIWLLRTVLR